MTTARRDIEIASGQVRRKYSNKIDVVMAGGADSRSPSDDHRQVFLNSCDWHSCRYWLLATCFSESPIPYPDAARIEALHDVQLKLGKACSRAHLASFPWRFK
jgi:hypothetical protein